MYTPFDFYRALNSARERSTKVIRVMKLHHLGPDDAEHDKVVEVAATNSSEVGPTYEEMNRWYEGLKEWNSRPGRLVERITVRVHESVATFATEAAKRMKGTTYLAHYLPWDGELPLLNLCVFDDREVILTFSTKKHENPYKPIPGVHIVSKDVARFFNEKYYERMVEYCSTHPVATLGKERKPAT